MNYFGNNWQSDGIYSAAIKDQVQFSRTKCKIKEWVSGWLNVWELVIKPTQ